MPISVASRRSPRGLATPLRALVRLVLAQEGRRAGEIAIVLADDIELRFLNRRYRRIDRATDVISFAYDEDRPDAAERPVQGDVVISLDRVRDQAKRYRVSEGRELARLVVHGALHLCGHDHGRETERRLMRARENAALRRAGPSVARMDRALGKAAT